MSCSLSSKRSDYAELPHGRQQTQRPPNSAMRHNPAYGIMNRFMRSDGDIGLRVAKPFERRHLDMIGGGRIERHRAAMADDGAGVGEVRVGVRVAFDRC